MTQKLCIRILVSLFFSTLMACSNSDTDRLVGSSPSGNSPTPPTPSTTSNLNQLSSSQRQLQAASYKNDLERTALSHFVTGTEFCEKYKDITSKESGFYVDVPADYSDATKGSTKIWAYFSSGVFNPEKPTMLYFDGGSGGNSHGSSQVLKNFNELHYDQRGIGCSHPESLEVYRNPDFYSNENNARDAEEIRKFLKIEKVSLYGASYGTVVATVYASLFGNHSTAVILDGTEFSDQSDSKIIGFYLKKMYATLSPGTQEGLKKYIDSSDKLTRLWMLARVLMYGNDPFGKLKNYLTTAFPAADQVNQPVADKILNPDLFNSVFFGDKIDAVEAFNNQMLNCKNMHQKQTLDISLFGPMGLTYMIFKDYEAGIDRSQECDAINAKENAPTYQADQYPIQVPVTYFQGNLDGATFASGAIEHYKLVPQAQKQLLIAVNGGHCPGMVSLMTKNPGSIEVIEAALLGNYVTPEQLAAMNPGAKDVKWVYTKK